MTTPTTELTKQNLFAALFAHIRATVEETFVELESAAKSAVPAFNTVTKAVDAAAPLAELGLSLAGQAPAAAAVAVGDKVLDAANAVAQSAATGTLSVEQVGAAVQAGKAAISSAQTAFGG